jgi:transglutaminase-like putative cysteine protease
VHIRFTRATTARRYRILLGIAVAVGVFVAGTALAAAPPSDAVTAMIDAGQFQAAQAVIDQALAQPGLDAAERSAYQYQVERMRRIRLDFSLDADAVKARLRKDIPDLTDAEFARWDAHGYLEHQVIDGHTLYFNRAPSNLFRLSAEARARRVKQTPFDDTPLGIPNPHHREVRDAALSSGKSSVAPRRVRVTQSLTVDADAVPVGQTVRAWIPYPQSLPGQQEDIRFVSSDPATHVIAPESAPQRTVYLEKPAQAGKPTSFSITYEVTVYAQYHQVDPAKVVPATITPELAPFVAERPPHIVFTEQMRLFSRQVVGEEKNPWRIAQKLFAAVDAIPWAGAREYSTLTNISDYALHAGHADCGQQTLLLMTLLRMNGIPSRWQSGAIFSDGKYWDIHDWAWLYIAPYGWMPVDVTFGRLDSPDPGIANFYLGGLDAYRLAFNSDYSQPLQPAKKFFRSDNVDSQRGEAEWSGGNLYYNQWDYGFKWQILPAASRRMTPGTQLRG